MPTGRTCWPPPWPLTAAWSCGAPSSTTPKPGTDRAAAAYDSLQRSRRPVRAERPAPGQERAHRLPAARAIPPAVRRHAEDAADARGPDHPGVPRPREPPRFPGPDVARVPRFGHVRPGPRLDRGPGGGRHPLRPSPHRHGRGGEFRLGSELDRPPLRPGQLVRLRPPGLGPRPAVAADRRGVDRHDAHARPRGEGGHRPHHARSRTRRRWTS